MRGQILRRRWILGLALGALLLVAVGITWAIVVRNRPIVYRNEAGEIIATLDLPLEHHVNPTNKDEYLPTLDGFLNGLVKEYARVGPEAMKWVLQPGPTGDTIAVIIHVHQGNDHLSMVTQALRDLGISPDRIYEDCRGIYYCFHTYVPLAHLLEIAQLPGVGFIRHELPAIDLQSGTMPAQVPPPVRGHTAQVPQAVRAHGAAAWHTAGLTGQGIKVGIIDSGFYEYAAVLKTGAVPAPADVLCYGVRGGGGQQVWTQDLSQCAGDNRHGTAVTEALFAVAPDAALYLARPRTLHELRRVVEWLVEQQVDIINYSKAWPWDGPGDGTSPDPESPLSTVAFAIANGIVWINSAGNHNLHTWHGQLNRGLLPWLRGAVRYDHIFARPSFREPPLICNWMTVWPPRPPPPPPALPEQDILIQLRWEDAWLGAARDLDLHLYDDQNKRIAVAGMGERRQTGGLDDDPNESIEGRLLAPGQYCIVIHDFSAAQGHWRWGRPHLQLQVYLNPKYTELEHWSGSGSILNPAESRDPGLLAVGASPYDAAYTIKERSSRGPTLDDRIKPELVGVDGVDSTTYGYPFEGTSQAAPHVAGLAALVRQRFPLYTPAQVTKYLEDHADPRPGSRPNHKVPNNIWGYGLAQLPPLTPTPGSGQPLPPALRPPLPGPLALPTLTPPQRWMLQLARLQNVLQDNILAPAGADAQDRTLGPNRAGGLRPLLEPTPASAHTSLPEQEQSATLEALLKYQPPTPQPQSGRSAATPVPSLTPIPLATGAEGSCAVTDNLDTVYPHWGGAPPVATIQTQNQAHFQAWQAACRVHVDLGWQRLEPEPQVELSKRSMEHICLISQGCDEALPLAYIADLQLISFALSTHQESEEVCRTDAQGVETCAEQVTYSGLCTEHRHNQPADFGSLELNLSQTSRTWITTELHRRYPGTGVRHSDPYCLDLDYSAADDAYQGTWEPADGGIFEVRLVAHWPGLAGQPSAHRVVPVDDVPVYLTLSQPSE